MKAIPHLNAFLLLFVEADKITKTAIFWFVVRTRMELRSFFRSIWHRAQFCGLVVIAIELGPTFFWWWWRGVLRVERRAGAGVPSWLRGTVLVVGRTGRRG